MAFFGSTALIHVSLSRHLVRSEIKGPYWPAEFFAAFDGMDSVENCIDFFSDDDFGMKGWRIFSGYTVESVWPRNVVHKVTGFEPILLRSEAIVYARAAREVFKFADEAVDFAARHALPAEVYHLLNGGR